MFSTYLKNNGHKWKSSPSRSEYDRFLKALTPKNFMVYRCLSFASRVPHLKVKPPSPRFGFGCAFLVSTASLDFGWTHHWRHYWTASGGLPAASFPRTRCDWNSSFRRCWPRASGGKGVNAAGWWNFHGDRNHPTRMHAWQMEYFLGISYTKNMIISYMTR